MSKLAVGQKLVRLQRWLNQDFVQRFQGRLLPVDAPVARTWGVLQGEAARRGESLPILDSLIAATAMAHQLGVVTRNVGDLERCQARVHNPWTE